MNPVSLFFILLSLVAAFSIVRPDVMVDLSRRWMEFQGRAAGFEVDVKERAAARTRQRISSVVMFVLAVCMAIAGWGEGARKSQAPSQHSSPSAK